MINRNTRISSNYFPTMFLQAREYSKKGLTLVELLVVLSILAILSTVAIRGVSDQVIETRYDANLEQLEAIEEAIIGNGEDFQGFVGDVGRLPQVFNGSLDELLVINSIDPFGIKVPDGDSEIRLSCGWRGPYLDLGLNQSSVTDGFGRSFIFAEPDGSDANTNGDTIGKVISLGQDGENDAPTTEYERDFEKIFQEDSTSTKNWSQDISVTVIKRDGSDFTSSDDLVVRIYGPGDDTTTTGVVESGLAVTIKEDPPSITSDIESISISFNDVPYGQKIFRAYLVNTLPSDFEEDIGPTAISKSQPKFVFVNRFTNSITLEL